VQSQDGQTATGDWADYDTRKNTVTIGGDVVLTRGPNVVRGSRLVIDMSTGHSVIETGAPSGWAARAQPANGAPEIAPPAAGGRPSAVFYPKALKDKAAAGGATGDASKPAARAPSKRQTIDGGS
jgi:lipopolysaccharide export system protein LptA